MNIILTFINGNSKDDFQVNNKMTVRKSLEIISRNTGFYIPKNINYIYSERNKKMLSVEYTYDQLDIYSGDTIIIKGE
ncbi:MAG: hypothetical protein ACLR60_03120 [Clostridium paraputrificum]